MLLALAPSVTDRQPTVRLTPLKIYDMHGAKAPRRSPLGHLLAQEPRGAPLQEPPLTLAL